MFEINGVNVYRYIISGGSPASRYVLVVSLD
jgi:hypothetical protein